MSSAAHSVGKVSAHGAALSRRATLLLLVAIACVAVPAASASLAHVRPSSVHPPPLYEAPASVESLTGSASTKQHASAGVLPSSPLPDTASNVLAADPSAHDSPPASWCSSFSDCASCTDAPTKAPARAPPNGTTQWFACAWCDGIIYHGCVEVEVRNVTALAPGPNAPHVASDSDEDAWTAARHDARTQVLVRRRLRRDNDRDDAAAAPADESPAASGVSRGARRLPDGLCDLGCLRYGKNNPYCPAAGAECSQYRDCTSCLDSSDGGGAACGWCHAQQQCLPVSSARGAEAVTIGVAGESVVPQCGTNTCPRGPFFVRSDPGAAKMCPGASTTMHGERGVALDMTTTTTSTATVAAAPPAKRCDDATDPSSCLAMEGACGWCTTCAASDGGGTASGLCIPAWHARPADVEAYPNTTTCVLLEASAHECTAGTGNGTCHDCLQVTNRGRGSCGWCATKNKCLPAKHVTYGVCEECGGAGPYQCLRSRGGGGEYSRALLGAEVDASARATDASSAMMSAPLGDHDGRRRDHRVMEAASSYCPVHPDGSAALSCSDFRGCQACTNSGIGCGWCGGTQSCVPLTGEVAGRHGLDTRARGTGPQQFVDRPPCNMDGMPVQMPGSDPNWCWALCNKTAGCESWATGIANCDGYDNKCWLKNCRPAATTQKCRWSGALGYDSKLPFVPDDERVNVTVATCEEDVCAEGCVAARYRSTSRKWAITRECPANEVSTCGGYTSCSECATDPVCGWCTATSRCVAATGAEPCAVPPPAFYENTRLGTDSSSADTTCQACALVATDASYCLPPNKSCGDQHTCGDCTSLSKACAWCTGNSKCVPYSANDGPPCTGSHTAPCTGCTLQGPSGNAQCAAAGSMQGCCSYAGTTCLDRGTCQSDGCHCNTPWSGDFCQTCPFEQGYYGATCERCDGNPAFPGACSGHGKCDTGLAGSGHCACEVGWDVQADCSVCSGTVAARGWAANCKDCDSTHWGHSCEHNCSCAQGTCDSGLTGDGACTCDDGAGAVCTADGAGVCNATTGACTCVGTGRWGSFCENSGLKTGTVVSAITVVVFVGVVICGSRCGLRRIRIANRRYEEHDTFDTLTFSLPNVLSAMSLLVHALQMAASAFEKTVPWNPAAAPVSTGIRASLLVVEGAVEFRVLFLAAVAYEALAMVVLPPFLVDVGSDGSSRTSLVDKCYRDRNPLRYFLAPFPAVLGSLSLLWMPVVRKNFEGFACTYTDVGRRPWLDALGPGFPCWTGQHMQYFLPALAGVVVFVPTMLTVLPPLSTGTRSSSKKQIVWSPVYHLVRLILHLFVAAMGTFLTTRPLANLSALLAASMAQVAALLFIGGTRGVCTAPAVTRWNITAMVCVAVCAVGGIASLIVDKPSNPFPFLGTLGGCALAVGVTIALQLGWLKPPSEANREMARRLNDSKLELHAKGSTKKKRRGSGGAGESSGNPGARHRGGRADGAADLDKPLLEDSDEDNPTM